METTLMILSYIKATLINNFIIKFIWWMIAWYISMVYTWNEELFKIIIVLFVIDWILWVLKAYKNNLFNSKAFFQWAFKISAYWILLYLWYAMDKMMPFEVFLWGIFSFIALTDISSIFENLEELWIPVPKWIVRFLSIHKDKLILWKIKQVTWLDLSNKFLDDLKQIDKYIENIPDKDNRELFKVKIVYLKRIIVDIIDWEYNDIHTMKSKIDLSFKYTWTELDRAVHSQDKSKQVLDKFWASHMKRFKQLVNEIHYIFENASEEPNKKELKQIKENVIQTIIRILYKNVSDKY